MCACVCEGQRDGVSKSERGQMDSPALGYRRNGVLYFFFLPSLTLSDQLRERVGEEAWRTMKEVEWMGKEEMTQH